MLGQAEISSMRSVARQSLISSCEILRLTPGDGLSTSDAWVPIATVTCSVAPSGNSPVERFIASQARPRSLWSIRLDPDQLAKAGVTVESPDRIREVGGNRLFNVVDVGKRTREILRYAVAEEVV